MLAVGHVAEALLPRRRHSGHETSNLPGGSLPRRRARNGPGEREHGTVAVAIDQRREPSAIPACRIFSTPGASRYRSGRRGPGGARRGASADLRSGGDREDGAQGQDRRRAHPVDGRAAGCRVPGHHRAGNTDQPQASRCQGAVLWRRGQAGHREVLQHVRQEEGCARSTSFRPSARTRSSVRGRRGRRGRHPRRAVR